MAAPGFLYVLECLCFPSYLRHMSTALSTFLERDSKDPTSLVWPPTLPIELALKTATPQQLKEEYGYSDAEWNALPKNPVFMADLASACELVKQEGMSFKLKAKLIAEENLKEAFRMVRDPATPPAVKGKMMEVTARWAGFDPRTNGEESGGGGPVNANTLNIQINLGTDF